MSAAQQQEKPADAWGQPISEERQAELGRLVERQQHWLAQPAAERGASPFYGNEPLTGADVSWLSEQFGRDQYGRVPNLHLEGARLNLAHLEGAILEGGAPGGRRPGGRPLGAKDSYKRAAYRQGKNLPAHT